MSETIVKTAEEWATAKGLLPEFSVPSAPKSTPKKRMRPVRNPAGARFRVAKFFHGWPVGKELTEADFDAAIAQANDPNQNTFR